MPTAAGTKFEPREVLFAPLSECNLHCRHCAVEPGPGRLPAAAAVRFLRSCRGIAVERVGFTGGEPFLAPSFLNAVAAEAVRLGLLFDRITTNARWFKTEAELEARLIRLRDAGYDGSFGVSLDAFHGAATAKPAAFIRRAAETWNRPDACGVIAVRGARDEATAAILDDLAERLGAVRVRRHGRRLILSKDIRIAITEVDLVPVGRGAGLIDPWSGRWFREDFCAGPGHVLYVLPDGTVKPCCGYATDSPRLTIGDIRRDTARRVIARARRNPFVRAVFESGLTEVRRRLSRRGVRFPGRTPVACAFCLHLLTAVPPADLDAALPPARP